MHQRRDLESLNTIHILADCLAQAHVCRWPLALLLGPAAEALGLDREEPPPGLTPEEQACVCACVYRQPGLPRPRRSGDIQGTSCVPRVLTPFAAPKAVCLFKCSCIFVCACMCRGPHAGMDTPKGRTELLDTTD